MNPTNQQEQLLHVFHDAIQLSEKIENEDIAQRLSGAREYFKAGKFYLLICGEVSRGKSSLINAYLKEPALCPVDAKATTHAVSLLSWGEQEEIIVHLSYKNEDGKTVKQEAKAIERIDIADYMCEHKEDGLQVTTEMFEIKIKNEKLKNGLTIVDSPGFGSLNPLHSAITFSYLPNADAAIFTGDCITPLADIEIDFASRLVNGCKKTVHVLTKKDNNKEWRLFVEDSRKKLAASVGEKAQEIPIHAVSCTLKQDYDDKGDVEDWEDSGFIELEQELEGIITKGESMLINRAASDTLSLCTELRAPLYFELDAASAISDEEIEAIKAKLIKANEHLKNLQDNQADWKAELRKKVNELNIDCKHSISGSFSRCRREIKDYYLEKDDYLNNPKQFESVLIAEISDTGSNLLRKVENGASSVFDYMFEYTKLGMYYKYQYDGPSGGDSSINRPEELTFWDKTAIVGGKIKQQTVAFAAAGSVAGAIIGGIVASFALPGIGTAAGASLGALIGAKISAAIGLIRGWFIGKATVKSEKKKKILEAVTPFINTQESELKKWLEHAMNECYIGLDKALTAEINREKKACLNTIKKQQEILKQTRSERNSSLKKIQLLIRQLDSYIEICAALIENNKF